MNVAAPGPPRFDRLFFSTPGILVLAAVIRLAFIFTMRNHAYYADTLEYESVALNLLHGHGLGASPRAPMFPLEMALGFLIGGMHNYSFVRVLEVLVSLGLTYAVMRIARLVGGAGAGIVAGLGIALSPTLIFVTGLLYPTNLYATILALAVWATLELARRPAFRRAALLGVLVPLGWLTDPVMCAPSLGLLAWLGTRVARRGGAAVACWLLVLAVVAAITLPAMALQRAASSGRPMFMQKAQYVLQYSRSDSSLSAGRRIRLPAGTPYAPLSMAAFFRRESGLLVRQPAAYLHDVGSEFVHFFKLVPDRIQTQNQYRRGPVLLLGALSFLPVLILSIWGLLRGRGAFSERLLLALVVLATALFYSLFFTQTRYRVPVEPEMIVLAALGLTALIPRLAPGFDEGGTAGRP